MMRLAVGLAFVCIVAQPVLGDTPTRTVAKESVAPELTPEVRAVVEKLRSIDPYRVPDLVLKTDANYAHTIRELEPYRHVTPYKEFFLKQMEYTGPGRAIEEPTGLATVKIGFIGPIYPTVSVATGGKSHGEKLGEMMLKGCQLAVEEANQRGGYWRHGIPFELVVHNDNGLWGASGNEVIDMVYKDGVWALLGTIDGANSHIVIRVALKAEIAVMNSGDTDPTFVETNIPWAIRCIADDRQMNYLLADYMYRQRGLQRVGIIRASNRYGRFGIRELKDASRRLGKPIVVEMAYEVGGEDFSLHLDRLEAAGVDAVVHWGDAADGAGILNQMRARGMDQPFFACDRCVSNEFVELAETNAEGVVCTYPWDPTRDDPKYLAFRRRFEERFGELPETYASHAYDGMNMLIWAIQVAGLNRAKIRDVLAHRTEPWPGVTGMIPFSAVLDDIGEVFLAIREDGQWNYYSRRQLGLPLRDGQSRGVSNEPVESPGTVSATGDGQ